LPAAIEWHAQEFMKRTGLVIETDIEQKEVSLPGKLAITLFRVFQESLTNVARHANASLIHVSLKLENQRLLMEVLDNGQGFLPEEIESKKTLGILGMKERIAIINGEYDIQSSPGKGTRVKVSVPLHDK
jgi:signal transduction histidine kinase